MSRHKVEELDGALLDAAVAQAEGYPVRFRSWGMEVHFPSYLDEIGQDGCYSGIWSPSTDWKQAGPIIERERIMIGPVGCTVGANDHETWEWEACTWSGRMQSGQTPLVAAMRAYVQAKLGDEVELP